MNDKKLLRWAEFVATKYPANTDGWVYSRDVGDLEHIRYRGDHTGYNHWTQRIKRAFDWKRLLGRHSLSRAFPEKTLKDKVGAAWAWIVVSLRKETNLPDGQINGIITHWEEDGEYIAMFQPRVGVKVIDFIRANPDNPHARAILDEMHACIELSWPSKDAQEAQ